MTAQTHVKQKSKQQLGNAPLHLHSTYGTVPVSIHCIVMVASDGLSIASPALYFCHSRLPSLICALQLPACVSVYSCYHASLVGICSKPPVMGVRR